MEGLKSETRLCEHTKGSTDVKQILNSQRNTYLDARLLLVRTIETLQKLYMIQADKTGPLVAALRDSQEKEVG